MNEYDFTLKFKLPNAANLDQLVEELGRGGAMTRFNFYEKAVGARG